MKRLEIPPKIVAGAKERGWQLSGGFYASKNLLFWDMVDCLATLAYDYKTDKYVIGRRGKKRTKQVR